MMNLAEYRNRTAGLADYLPWAALVAPGVVLNKDGSFQRDRAIPRARPRQRNAGRARRHDQRAAQQCACAASAPAGRSSVEAARLPGQLYPRSPLSRCACRRWSTRSGTMPSSSRRRHFESRYFLTFLWLPPAEDAARAEALALRRQCEATRSASSLTSRCAASSIAPTACSSSSKASCRKCRLAR